mmetsp:Transcript_24933/g.82920  ORF Transcript_24933/g.82920 Transcript_24933/m.82920 type:complete len:236 (+) Transcript_24933:99-806(+)
MPWLHARLRGHAGPFGFAQPAEIHYVIIALGVKGSRICLQTDARKRFGDSSDAARGGRRRFVDGAAVRQELEETARRQRGRRGERGGGERRCGSAKGGGRGGGRGGCRGGNGIGDDCGGGGGGAGGRGSSGGGTSGEGGGGEAEGGGTGGRSGGGKAGGGGDGCICRSGGGNGRGCGLLRRPLRCQPLWRASATRGPDGVRHARPGMESGQVAPRGATLTHTGRLTRALCGAGGG